MEKKNITVTLPLQEFERLQNIEKAFNDDIKNSHASPLL